MAELPQILDDGVRFAFAIDDSGDQLPDRVLLSWYRGRGEDAPLPVVQAGERWRFVVRLKRPHGSANPGGFDYEAWLLERNVRATGYVRQTGQAVLLEVDGGGFMHQVHRLRDRIRRSMLAALPDSAHAGVLIALAVGDQRAIRQQDWDTFRRTGVSHLVAISGMHVSLLGMMAGGLCALLWRRVPWLVLRFPVRKAAAVVGLLAAFAYGLLAGLGIPVQRALVMLAVIVAALLTGRELNAGRVLALALMCVLLIDPWAVLSAGFWLSFSAVGIILLVVTGRVRPVSAWRAAVSVQIAITFATIPALLVLFDAFSPVSPLANAIAIPLVNFIITPLALCAIVWPDPFVLIPAHAVTAAMMWCLEGLSALPQALWRQASAPVWLSVAAACAALILLLPRATPGKGAAAGLMLALLAWQAPRPLAGEFAATVLDVGQGLAVHVSTATHDLLYDTGPPYGPSSDAGDRILVPYLNARGVGRIDSLILSHDDADHVGGTLSVLESVPTTQILAGEHLSSERGFDAWPVHLCSAGQAWEWDGVRFEILSPASDIALIRRNNERSCVLRVQADGGTLLLVGDIEHTAETALVSAMEHTLASSAIVVGHHGSKSSSSEAFVDAVMPELAIFSVGHRNPFGHPHPSIWSRWSEAGARNYRTDSQGSIVLTVEDDGVSAKAWRSHDERYWHGR